MSKHIFYLLIGGVLLYAQTLSAATLVVDTTGQEGDSLQAAMDSAASLAGMDTVLLESGTYHLAINLDTSISGSDTSIGYVGLIMLDSVVLMSESGAFSCTLTAISATNTDTAWHVIYCNDIGSSSVIQGLTITSGNADGVIHCRGGGLYISRDSSPTLIDNIITNNTARSTGWGIFIERGSSPILNGNVIANNSASWSGGGLFIDESSPILTGNTITGNSSYHGGGLRLYPNSSPTLINNIIAGNSAENCGGGFLITTSSPTLSGNTITRNSARCGGGIYTDETSSVTITRCVMVGNRGEEGGAVYGHSNSKVFMDSCFVLDNGSTQDNKSGLVYLASDADTMVITHSHLYYNTMQPDTEIYNATTITLPFEHNFWWDTTGGAISAIIDGPNDHDPWENDFITGVPGEPISVDSVLNYDKDFANVVDSLAGSDSLYLRIYGEDRNSGVREAAVAILRSSVYPTGVAVALTETDTNSGVYEGRAFLLEAEGTYVQRTDDIYQWIRVNPDGDTVMVVANVDPAKQFRIRYGLVGVEEQRSKSKDAFSISHPTPNPFTTETHILYYLSRESHVRLTVYDGAGRLVRTVVDERQPRGYYGVNWNGRDATGTQMPSGVYFYRFRTDEFTSPGKIILLR